MSKCILVVFNLVVFLRKLNYNYDDSSKNNGAIWEVQWAKTFSGGEQGCRKCEDQKNSLLKFYEYL